MLDNIKVNCRIIHDGSYGLFPFYTAIDAWTHRRGIQVSKEPELYDWESDEEKALALSIIEGIWTVMAENPKTEWRIRSRVLEPMEDEILKDVTEILSRFSNKAARKEYLIDELQKSAKYSEYKYDTIRKRLDDIALAGDLTKFKIGTQAYFSLTPKQRMEQEIHA